MADRIKLVAGPAKAISNSLRGFLVSSSMSETPPKIKRIICRTFMPNFNAIIECDSSWSSTEANRSIAPAMPMTQYSSEVRPGKSCGIKLIASVQATRENTTSSVKCRRMEIPLIRPIWMDKIGRAHV